MLLSDFRSHAAEKLSRQVLQVRSFGLAWKGVKMFDGSVDTP